MCSTALVLVMVMVYFDVINHIHDYHSQHISENLYNIIGVTFISSLHAHSVFSRYRELQIFCKTLFSPSSLGSALYFGLRCLSGYEG